MSTLSLWTRRDPFTEFDAIVRDTFGPLANRSASTFAPAAEAGRDGDDAVLKLELPGVDVAKDVTVELEHGRLVVRGERRDERTEEQPRASLREVRYGSFRRSFAVPAHVTPDAVTASYDAGMLTVRVAGAYAGTTAQRIAVTNATSAPAVDSAAEAETPDDAPSA